jgi:hypothetical protein
MEENPMTVKNPLFSKAEATRDGDLSTAVLRVIGPRLGSGRNLIAVLSMEEARGYLEFVLRQHPFAAMATSEGLQFGVILERATVAEMEQGILSALEGRSVTLHVRVVAEIHSTREKLPSDLVQVTAKLRQ